MIRFNTFFLWAFIFLSLGCSYEFLPHSMRSLFVLSMILISTVVHYRCVGSNTLFHRLFFPKSVDHIIGEVASLTVNGLALIEFSWRNPDNEDFKETILSWTRSSNGETGSSPARSGAPGSSDEITLRLEPGEYTFTLTAVDTQSDTSKPWRRVIYVGPSCHTNNPDLSSLRNTNLSPGFGLNHFDAAATTDGFRSLGEAMSDNAGFSISSGDINGDGFDDVLIGAIKRGTNDEGAGYVIFGKENGLINMSLPPDSDSGDGFRILGAAASDYAGRSISSGDIDGDGFDDVLIGATGVDRPGELNTDNAGAGYVIFGKENGLTSMTLPPDHGDGFTITGAAMGDNAGRSVSSGDINGDGIKDVLIGASVGGTNDAGAGYIIFGKDSGLMNMPLPPNPGDGFTITGAVIGDYAGVSISSGDINGDGFDDVLIGASRLAESGQNRRGAGYVIFGSDSPGDIALTNSNNFGLGGAPDTGFRILGAAMDDFTGASISSGDINGDGFDDVLIGASGLGSSNRGAGYVIFGRQAVNFNDITLAGSGNFGLGGAPDTGFRILGADTGDFAGVSISSGDIDGDGIGDVLIGARKGGTNDEGAGYVIFGRQAAFNDIMLTDTGNFGLGSAPDRGFRILGADADDYTGDSISSGDINGDGIGDVFIGATGVDANSMSNRGAGYAVLGTCQP